MAKGKRIVKEKSAEEEEEDDDALHALIKALPAAVAAAVKAASGKKEEPDPLLKQILLDLHLTSAPANFNLDNPQVLKEPLLWVAYLAGNPPLALDLKTRFRTDGELLVAFHQSLLSLYGRDIELSSWAKKMCIRLKEHFLFFANALAMHHPKIYPEDAEGDNEGIDPADVTFNMKHAVQELLDLVKATVDDAKSITLKLEVEVMRQVSGQESANAYFASRSAYSANDFALNSDVHLKRAFSAKTEKSNKRAADPTPASGAGNPCRACGVKVSGKDFRQHNLVCTGK